MTDDTPNALVLAQSLYRISGARPPSPPVQYTPSSFSAGRQTPTPQEADRAFLSKFQVPTSLYIQIAILSTMGRKRVGLRADAVE